MAQTNQDDTFYAGNTRVLQFAITDAEVDPPVPLDLTGCTVQWALSAMLIDGSYDTVAILKKDSAGTDVIIDGDPSTGIVRVRIRPADTAELAGRYYHELEVIDVAGNPVVVATGYLTINPNVVNA